MKNFYQLVIGIIAIITLTVFSARAQNVGIGTATPAQKLEIAGTSNTIRINGLKSGASYNQLNQATSSANIMYVNGATGDLYALPTGATGSVLTISSGSVPTWAQPTSGTVTSVGANLPLSVTNPTSTPVVSLIGTTGQILYGTGTASAFTTGGSSGEVLGWGSSGVPTWVTGSGQYILNQNSVQQTANFWISGNASIGTAPVSAQQLTVAISSGGTGISVTASGNGIGVSATGSGGGTGVLGSATGNTGGFNGGYGVEGEASSGGVGVWANSSGQTNATPALGGFGLFATGTYNAQAGVYAFLNGVSGGTPSPHGTTIPAFGAVYAQTTSTSSTTTPNAWAIIANNSGSATPTNNGLLVFGTTSEIGAVTLGANSTSYFTTGGAKANGSLVFDNSTNTNQVTINTGVTSASYPLTLPTTQGVANSLLYNADGAGTLTFSSAGTSGQVLTANSSGVPTWGNANSALATNSIVAGGGSSVVVGNGTGQVVGASPVTLDVQGASGGIFYGTGLGSSATFTTTGTAGQILESGGTGVPTWVTGSGQFIQNQSSAQQTANFWISGNASIGAAPVSSQQLTISSSNTNTIGVYATNSTGSSTSIEGINSGGGTGVLGTVSGNTGSNNGGYGVEGAASAGGVGVWANSSGQTNPTATPPLGGFGLFATGTYNSQAGVYAFLNGVSGGTPSPHGTTIPALGAVYAQTTSTSSTTTPNAWAIIANSSGSATPTNNGLLVFGTTSEIGAVTLGANSTSYFTTGGAKANGSLVFDNSTNTNQVTINTGVTSASYPLTLPTTQGVANSLLYNADGAGTLTFSSAGTSGQVLTANASGVPTWSTPSGGTVTGVGTVAPIYNTGTPTSPVIAIQGLPSGADAGGVLYSTGSGNSAVFNSTGTAGEVLLSGGTGVPTWASANSALATSNITNTGLGSSVVVGNGTGQVVGASPVTLDVQGASGGIFYGTGLGSSATFTTAGTAGQILESGGTGVPTWVTGSGQFIQNQSSAQQTANFWISGNASIGTAPVSTQQLTVAAPSTGIGIAVTASGSGSIGVVATTTASSGGGIEGNNSGGGFGVFGNVSGNTGSFNGGYGVEGAASSGGTGVWANSSSKTNGTPALGGFGLFATGTYNAQAGVYAFLNGVSGGTPSPHGTTIPAFGAVYAQTTSTNTTTTPNAWAIVANNSGSATPTNNGLLVFGTTNAIGTLTLGSNTTSYFTTGGVTNSGSLVFDNSTNTNTVTINTGITSANYALTIPVAQGAVNSVLYNADGAGTLAFTGTGSSGQVLTLSSGVPTWVTPTATSASAWQLTGNVGTSAGTDFVGTTDGNDLVFKTNNTENMRIANSSGYVGINTPAPNSTLHVNGSMSLAVNLISANYNAGASDYVIEGDCSNNNIIVTLPDASTIKGRVYVIVRHDLTFNSNNALTINTTSGQTIGQYSSGVISLGTDYQQEYVLSDGSNWIILSSSYN